MAIRGDMEAPPLDSLRPLPAQRDRLWNLKGKAPLETHPVKHDWFMYFVNAHIQEYGLLAQRLFTQIMIQMHTSRSTKTMWNSGHFGAWTSQGVRAISGIRTELCIIDINAGRSARRNTDEPKTHLCAQNLHISAQSSHLPF